MATEHSIDPRTRHGNGPLVTKEEPQLRDLLKQLASDGGDLVRNEIALAKLETRDMARELAVDSAKVAGAIALALAGVLTVVAAAVIALGNALAGRYALAALIVGAALLGIGAVSARAGVARLKRGRRPHETAQSLRRDKDWARHEMQAFRQHIRS